MGDHAMNSFKTLFVSGTQKRSDAVADQVQQCSFLVANFISDVLQEYRQYESITIDPTPNISPRGDLIQYTLREVQVVDMQLHELVKQSFHGYAKLNVVLNGWGEYNSASGQRMPTTRTLLLITDIQSLLVTEYGIAASAWRTPASKALLILIILFFVLWRWWAFWALYEEPWNNFVSGFSE